MFDYFRTKDAEYSIYNDKCYIHLNAWDKIAGFKYHKQEISIAQYQRAYMTERLEEYT